MERPSGTIRNTIPISSERPRRADAQRNLDALLLAAKAVFARSGVSAPAKEIADEAGVGVGTLYRHFPKRSDLVTAVFTQEVDACAQAAGPIAAANSPFDALRLWLHRFTEFVATKRGLVEALHSGDPAFDGLPAYFQASFGPVLSELLGAASAAGSVETDLSPDELLAAVSRLCQPGIGASGDQSSRLVDVFVNGLRAG